MKIDKIKKIIKYLLPISLLLILSCYIYFNTEGYDSIIKFFNKNEKELNELSLIIYNQNKIKNITHKNFDNCFPFTLISDNRNSYYIIASNGESFEIEIDKNYEDEETFWKKGLEDMVDSHSKRKVNLILKELEIPENLFLEIIHLMNKVDLFAIITEYNRANIKYLKFFVDLNEGLLINPNSVTEEVESKTVIRKRINANWFYLYEKNY